MKLTITAKKVKEAAETSTEAKEALKKLFPEVFAPEKFRFATDGSRKFTIGQRVEIESPLFIADGLAPDDMKFRCLGVGKEWEMHTFQHMGYTMISFTKKEK